MTWHHDPSNPRARIAYHSHLWRLRVYPVHSVYAYSVQRRSVGDVRGISYSTWSTVERGGKRLRRDAQAAAELELRALLLEEPAA